jgi:hypothetical protein
MKITSRDSSHINTSLNGKSIHSPPPPPSGYIIQGRFVDPIDLTISFNFQGHRDHREKTTSGKPKVKASLLALPYADGDITA